MGSFGGKHARANSTGDQSKEWIHLFLELDEGEYTIYYILPKFRCLKPYGGGEIGVVVIAPANNLRPTLYGARARLALPVCVNESPRPPATGHTHKGHVTFEVLQDSRRKLGQVLTSQYRL